MDMDVDTLRAAVEQTRFAAAGVAFLTGLVFSFNPVALAAIPMSLAYVTRARETRQAIAYSTSFVLGMIVTHAVLGVVAGFGGEWVAKLLGRFWGLVLGPLLIVLGIAWLGLFTLPLPAMSFRAKRATGVWGAFVLGIPFSIAVCPFCTPALVVLLGVVAAIGSPLLGLVLLVAFAIGRTIPIALGAYATGWLEHLKPLDRYRRVVEVLGALVLIATGLYMLNAYYFVIPWLAR